MLSPRFTAIAILLNGILIANALPASYSSSSSEYNSRELETVERRGDLAKGAQVLGGINKGLDVASKVASAAGPEVALAVDVVKFAAQAMEAIFKAISSQQHKDALKRGDFTQKVVDQTLQQHPGWNIVVVHTKHTTNFEGTKGRDWDHQHQELKVGFPVGSTIGFEIYTFRGGSFNLQGDGGYENWAWGGQGSNVGGNSKSLKFTASPLAKGTAAGAEPNKAAVKKASGKKRSPEPVPEPFFDDEWDMLD